MANPILDELMHYGMPRRSGRYPWGSGENPYQHEEDFLKEVHEKRDKNFTFTDTDGKTYTGDLAIAKSMGLTSTQFRTQLSLANNNKRKKEVEMAKKLRAEGKSLNEIAAAMGYENDSSIRSLLNVNSEARMLSAEKTAEFLKKQVDEKGMLIVGKGSNKEINGETGGISPERMKQALYILEMQGYPVYGGGIPQVTNPGKQTNVKVLCPPGTQHKEIYNFDKLHTISEDWVSHDGGETFEKKWVYPESMSSKRLMVRYADEGGKEKDGVIEIRRGVQDLDLGGSHYAQVRIMVDGTHYLKGMAIYGDDKEFPDGVDVIFNTNKTSGTPVLGPKDHSVLKPIKNDPRNPFGSLIKEGIDDPEKGTTGGGQRYYIDDKTGEKKLSLINKRSDEGDWGEWADKLPSQFLAKQTMTLINRQLNIAKADKKAEFDEIMSYNNPTVRKKLLRSFADDCDASAVHLKAAALPRQSYQVILPMTTLKDNEVYAPNYRDGETVALVRYPHGGTFEIPILKVNNRNPEGRRIYGTSPKDAVGISKNVAERLSGADFDGDTVMVIPCNNPGSSVNILSTKSLTDGFDDVFEYGGKPEGTFKKMKNTQTEMGIISNLIMDMTLKGANNDELARAVKHSMVVIDAEKHNLDYKASEKDFGIAALKKRYQGHIGDDGKYHEGASTLITLAKSPKDVLKTKGSPIIDPKTGKVSYKTVVEKYIGKDGKEHVRTKASTKMAETDDAYTLSTGTPQEDAYADYANYLKALANTARKTMVNTKDMQYSPSAKITYQKEHDSLMAKLNAAILNKPREQLAQAKANAIVNEKKKMDPTLTQKELKKIRQQALTDARTQTGASRQPFPVSPKEWEAIQAGAISASKLYEIMQYMDDKTLKEYTLPKTTREISEAKQSKIRAMAAQGYTPSEIASATGVSTTTVNKYIK